MSCCAFYIRQFIIFLSLMSLQALGCSGVAAEEKQEHNRINSAIVSPQGPAAPAENADIRWPRIILLWPEGCALQAHWLSPPLSEDLQKAIARPYSTFIVDAHGTPWLNCSKDGQDLLLNPVKRHLLALRHPQHKTIKQLVSTETGAILARTEEDFGFFVISPDDIQPKENGISYPMADYQPIALLPAANSPMHSGRGHCLFFIVSRQDGGSDVYLYEPKGRGFAGFVRIFSSPYQIAAVAGDHDVLFAAIDGTIIKIPLPAGEPTKLYSQHGERIKQLAWAPGVGVFYNTGAYIGFLGEKGAQFLLAKMPEEAQMCLQNDILYICLEESWAILAIEHISDLQRFDRPLKPVATADLGISLQNVHFFAHSPQLQKLPDDLSQLAIQNEFVREDAGDKILYCLLDFHNRWHNMRSQSHLVKIELYRNKSSWPQNIVQTFSMPADWPGCWIWPSLGPLREFLPGQYIAKIYLDGALVHESAFQILGLLTLEEAVSLGDVKAAQAALQAGADVNKPNASGYTPLHKAAAWGAPEMIKLLLAYGANVNSSDEYGYTPLMLAIKYDNEAAVPLLLRAKADVHRRNKYQETALHLAAKRYPFGPQPEKAAEIIRQLLRSGADVNAQDANGYTPLLFAIMEENTAALVALLQAQPNLNAAIKEGLPPLYYAAVIRPNAEIVRLLIEKGANAKAIIGSSEKSKSLLYDVIVRLSMKINMQRNSDNDAEAEIEALQKIAWLLQLNGAMFEAKDPLSQIIYFSGLEKILTPANLFMLLSRDENWAQNYVPPDIASRRVLIAVLLDLAQRKIKTKEYAKGIDFCQRAQRLAQEAGLAEEEADAIYDEAVLWLGRGERKQAEQLLGKCIERAPKSAAARQARALLNQLRRG